MDNKSIHIRPYLNSDRENLIDLLQLNIPAYFSSEEEKEFIHYLDTQLEDYFVVEQSHKIIGCGGINTEGKAGILSWAFLHPSYQQMGIGTILLFYRIKHLFEQKHSTKIIVRTSQQVYRFYQKNGFKLLEVKRDYWAKGFDLYLMEYQHS